MPNPPANRDPIETFNVDPLSTEGEMDAVDALLSLQDLCDDTKGDPIDENAELMPIGGLNLPVDTAPVPIELNQIQVDHAIAKLAEQEEEEAAADDGKAQTTVDKDTVETDPNSANLPADDSYSDARLSSPQSKGI